MHPISVLELTKSEVVGGVVTLPPPSVPSSLRYYLPTFMLTRAFKFDDVIVFDLVQAGCRACTGAALDTVPCSVVRSNVSLREVEVLF